MCKGAQFSRVPSPTGHLGDHQHRPLRRVLSVLPAEAGVPLHARQDEGKADGLCASERCSFARRAEPELYHAVEYGCTVVCADIYTVEAACTV